MPWSRSPPLAGAWIEIGSRWRSCTTPWPSPPLAGAWIEIAWRSRHPTPSRWSPPLAGAWIEIKRDDDGQGLRRSPPLAGAWIEMPSPPGTPGPQRSPPSRGRGLKYRWHRSLGTRSAVAPPRGGRGLKSPSSSAAGGSSPVAPSRGAWIEIAAHTAPRRTRPSPLRPVCPPGAPSCRPEKSSFVPSVVMYPVSFQLFVSPKNSFADFTWPFFSASE